VKKHIFQEQQEVASTRRDTEWNIFCGAFDAVDEGTQ
jgi:hypothetical protein